MTTPLILYFLIDNLVWLLAFRLYRRWVGQPGGFRMKSVTGIALAYAHIASQCLPFSGLIQPRPGDGRWDPPAGLEGSFCLAVAVLGLAGIVGFSSRMKNQASLGRCPTETDRWSAPGTAQAFRRARERLATLQRGFQERLGIQVPLALTESLERPTLVGLNPHRIYVPVEIASDCRDLGALLEPLARWAGHKRYRAYMFLWWVAQVHVLLRPLTAGIGLALERELAREAGRQGCGGAAPGTGDPAPGLGLGLAAAPAGPADPKAPLHDRLGSILPVLALAGVSGWGACLAGGLDSAGFRRLAPGGGVPGFSVHTYNPGVRFRPLPGAGGMLPDGLLVDTTGAPADAGCTAVRLPLGLSEAEKLVPFGADVLNIHLEWKVINPGKRAGVTPAVKVACYEQSPMDDAGRQRLRTYCSRSFVLEPRACAQGALDLAIRLHPPRRSLPQSTDMIHGPLLFIPQGWKIGFFNYYVTRTAPGAVPPVPAGEAGRFAAWRERNEHWPAQVDLGWRARPGRRSAPGTGNRP